MQSSRFGGERDVPREPPSFEDARTRRQQVRAAGLSPDHWYAVEYERALGRGATRGTTFWGTPITLARDAAGAVHARSAGRPPYPVQQRYGLVWLFPGDPALAEVRAMPEVPELEGPDPWAYVPLGFTWRAHHSMVVDNVCDLSHAHLHRRYPAFQPGHLLECRPEADRVLMRYEARVGPLLRASGAPPNVLTIGYEYPYHWAHVSWSNIEGRITYRTFMLPLDARTTRVFFMFCYDTLRIRGLPLALGHRVLRGLLHLGNVITLPLLRQDGFALEAEQDGWERHFDAPAVELNPVVGHLHALTIRKWREHLAGRAPAASPALAPA